MPRMTKDVDEIRRCRIEFRTILSKHGISLPDIQGPPAGRAKELGLLNEDLMAAVLALKKREAESPEKSDETAMIAQQISQLYQSLRRH
jgi:hypothetical protein